MTAPTVQITSPSVGAVLSGDTVDFSWTGSDADGDPLSYLVQYSSDAGASYKTIAVGHPTATLSLDRSTLAGSTQARLRVVASDGTRSAAAESAVFTVAGNAPEVLVRSPIAGAVYGGLRSIMLEASAYDPEDGAIEGSSISWSSSIDGAISASGTAVIDTGDLTAGAHTLTATATDSDNMTATATVTVTVKATNDPPAAADDTAHARVGASAVVDVAANDTDPESDIDPRSTSVVVPAAAGTAAGSRGAVVYTPQTAGIDVLVYEICDQAAQCATAELTVVAIDDA